MTSEPTAPVFDQYTLFWKKFRLFPTPWMNALIRRPPILYLIYLFSYGAFVRGLTIDSSAWNSVNWGQPETLRLWVGDVFVAYAEVHILIMTLFFITPAIIRWGTTIPATFEWLHQPKRRIDAHNHEFDSKYLSYLDKYQQRLRSKIYSTIFSLSIIIVVLVFVQAYLSSGGYLQSNLFDFMFSEPWSSALFVMFMVAGYFMGSFIWPIIVTMQFVKGLSDHFSIEIQPSHPDKCGGLKPLGDFCLSMSLPVIIGGLVLSFVSIVGLFLSVSDAGYDLYRYFDLGNNRKLLAFVILDFSNDLDSGLLPEGLVQVFNRQNRFLTQNAAVEIQKAGQVWVIKDDREFTIYNDNDRLAVYENLYFFDPFIAYISLVILILIATPMILITFFIPLWNIHRFMVTQKRCAEDEFANNVAGLEEQIRSQINIKEGIEIAKTARDKLEIIQSINPNNTGYPVWPFRTSIVFTLFSPTFSQLLGLS